MHLINVKLSGQEIPASLPVSLVPPSLREEYGPGKQEVLQSSATKDLFDLFADEPPASKAASPAPQAPAQAQASTRTPAPGPASAPAQPPALPARSLSQQPPPPTPQTPFLPQPPPPPSRRQASHATSALSPTPTGQQPSSFQGSAFASPFSASPAPAAAPAPASRGGDLLSDDAETSSTPVPDHSAELGNKQNQLAQTTRSITDLSSQRTELEGSDKSSKQQLEELEGKLAAAREKHQTELRAVADLRTRVGEQQAKVKKLNSDLITASSDLSALQSEKTELEQSLLHDKEEVRSLQRRMKEVDDEKQGLVLVLEKLRKEARQQKGMVSIAKKQVSTAEGARDEVQAEMKGVEKEIEEDKAFLVQHEKNQAQQQQQQAKALSPQSTGIFAAGIALPPTPQALSPAATGMSNRSNNPFDRFLASGRSTSQAQVPSSTAATAGSPSNASTPTGQTPPQAVSAPASAAEESTDRSLSPGSPFGGIAETTGSAFGSVGAAATAAAGAVAAGAAGLYETAKHAVTDEPEHDPHLDTSSPSAAPTSVEVADGAASRAVEEGNLNTERDVAEQEVGPITAGEGEGQQEQEQEQEQDPFGAPSGGFGFAGEDEKTPIAQQEELDPFGAPQVPGTTIASTAGAENNNGIPTDPFGAPAIPQADGFSEQQGQAAGSQDGGFNDFEEGFGDSFGATGTTTTATTAPAEKAVAGAEQEANKAPTDFDSAFAEFDSPAETPPQFKQHPQEPTLSPNQGIPSGIPKSELPVSLSERPEAERTFSTQATIAPESEPITPMADIPGEYRSREEGSSGVPSSRGSTPGLAGVGAAAAVAGGGVGVGVGSALAHEFKPELEPEPEQQGGYEHSRQQVQGVNVGESSDEDEGPEDLERPRKGYGTKGAESSVSSPIEQEPSPTSAGAAAALAPPIAGFMTVTEDTQPKVRRSAPPPPSKTASASSAVVANPAAPAPSAPSAPATESETVSPVVATAGGVNPGEEFDPFGAPMVANVNAAPGNIATTQGASYIDAPSTAASQAHPKTASFDEDDFDFSDLPPAQVESGIPVAAVQQSTAIAGGAPPSAGFDDEFATFDDEFEKPEELSAGNGSENSSGNKSYEMVSPQPKPSGLYDEWGFGSSAKRAGNPQEQQYQNQQGASGFGDAFGTQASQGTQQGGLSFDDAFGNDFEPSS